MFYKQLKLINTNKGKGKKCPPHLPSKPFLLMVGTDATLFTPFPPGRWPHDAAHSLDASREHHVQEVHHRK